MPESETPSVPSLSILDPDLLRDPYRAFAEAASPSGMAREPDLGIRWSLRHQAIATLLRSPEFGKDPTRAAAGPYTDHLLDAGHFSILYLDGADHDRIRRLVQQAFSRRSTDAWGARVAAIVASLLDDAARHGDVDLIDAFAVPLPIMVIAEILGIDTGDLEDFRRWSRDGALAFDPFLSPDVAERVRESVAATFEYLQRVVAERRSEPRDDLISHLVEEQDGDGTSLSDDELVDVVGLLLGAGNITTTDLIGNGILALLDHPHQLEALRADPQLIGAAVEEILRFDSPVIFTDRVALVDTEVEGCPVRAGDWISPALGAANRDPAVYAHPDTFDIRRTDHNHVSFGGGPHFCLGAPLARLEARVAIDTLVRRFPRLTLDDRHPRPSRKLVPGFRGLTDLRVRLHGPDPESASRASSP